MISSVLNIIRKHWAAVVFALVVSFFMYLPQYWFERDLGESYAGVYFAVTDSEEYYAARIGEIYDGHWKLANPYLFEYKNLPYIQPPLPELLYAGVGKLFGWNRTQAVLYGSRLVIPFLLTLLVYAFVYSISRSRLLGVVAAAAILLGLNVLLDPAALPRLLQLQTAVRQGLSYARPVSPQVHSLFLFAYLLLFWKWLQTSRRGFMIAASMILGLSFYVYFYLWSFLFAGLGVAVLLAIVRKDFSLLKWFITHVSIALLLAIPYAVNLWQFYQLPDASLLAHLQGVIASREIKFDATLFVGLVVLLLGGRRLDRRLYWGLVSLLLGGFVALNQQVLTGKELHAAHYHWYLVAPLVAVTLIVVVWTWLRHYSRFLAIGGVAALVILAMNAVVIQRATYVRNKDFFASQQRYVALFEWLNKNTSKDSVVLTYSQWLADILPVYTHSNVLTAVQAQLSTTPKERIEFDFYLPVYLQGVTADQAFSYFKERPALVANLVGGVATRLQFGGCRTCFPETEFERVTEGYKKFFAEDLDHQLARYRLDYMVADTVQDRWPVEFFERFTLIATVGDFRIYKKDPIQAFPDK